MKPVIGRHHRPAEFRRTATDPTREGCAVELFEPRRHTIGGMAVRVVVAWGLLGLLAVCGLLGLLGLLAAWFAGWLS